MVILVDGNACQVYWWGMYLHAFCLDKNARSTSAVFLTRTWISTCHNVHSFFFLFFWKVVSVVQGTNIKMPVSFRSLQAAARPRKNPEYISGPGMQPHVIFLTSSIGICKQYYLVQFYRLLGNASFSQVPQSLNVWHLLHAQKKKEKEKRRGGGVGILGLTSCHIRIIIISLAVSFPETLVNFQRMLSCWSHSCHSQRDWPDVWLSQKQI